LSAKELSSCRPSLPIAFAPRPSVFRLFREADNGRRFAELYCPLLPEIVVPQMYFDYTTAR
jgi:hypothetical protein